MEGKGLGWHTTNPAKAAEVIESTAQWSIKREKSGKVRYIASGFPQLSETEKEHVGKAIESFQCTELKPEEENIARHFKKYCIENLIELEREQKDYLLHVFESSVKGFGPLDCVLANNEVEEIALIGVWPEPVRIFHKRLGWIETNIFFESVQAVCDTVNRMSQRIGRRLSFQTPSINAVLPDGSRLHAAMQPVVQEGACFTIRKFAKEFFTPLQLIENETMSCGLAAFVWIALESGCSVMVAGNTGSGKTTTLNSLFSFVPESERVVVVEETPEICLPHRHVVRMNVAEEQGIGMGKLILDTLRMRPDRVVVGEVRSKGEIGAFVDTLLAGQGKGSYCTFHSQSVEEAVKRAAIMGIGAMDLAAIDLVLVQRRWDKVERGQRKEVRHVTEAAELLLEGDSVKVNRIFEFDYGKGELVQNGQSIRVAEKAAKCFSMAGEGLEKEIKKRARVLSGMQGKGLSLREFFGAVNNEARRNWKKE